MHNSGPDQVATNKQRGEIHFGFVELLFALAAAQVGIAAADLVESIPADELTIPQIIAVASHLLLAGFVIAASWVGWGHSEYGPRGDDVKTVFGWDFVELFIDVLLVVFYFILVRAVEAPVLGPDGGRVLTPSAAPEARWIAVILVTYFIWDLVSKRGKWRQLRLRIAYSTTCACLGVALWFVLPIGTTHAIAVTACDIALLSLMLLFRALKGERGGLAIACGVAMVMFSTAATWLAN